LVKSDLDRAELSSFRIPIHNQISTAAMYQGTEILGIRSGNNENEFAVTGQCLNGARKESALRQGRVLAAVFNLGPRQQRFVASHARRLSRREKDSA
jgi:hypothetical protein